MLGSLLLWSLCVSGRNKFNSFHVENGGDTAMSNFAEYYGLVEEERGDGGGTGCSSRCVSPLREMETRGAETTSLLPTTIRRFVRAMEGATDMPVACTLRVTDGPRLVDERLSTIMPGERCTSGGSETTGLRPIDDVGAMRCCSGVFCSPEAFLCPAFLPVCFCRGGVGGMRCGCGVGGVIHALF
ncbi:hypothetical protein C4B63_22g140 [Trypanosoma cruzi]|uniref:Uncharacterized protein n=1 Tax=Trypanosoma cruzi TaxID=5693 RepID=A0A2V2VH38_TRYCR|nr:hypothetical protein C4B63_22g140 [Trypanosoma cruzi]